MFVGVSSLQAATYHVKAGGNDSLAGTSDATAWAHSPGMSNATGVAAGIQLQPGDSVLFKRGDTFIASSTNPWLEITASGTATSPITFGAYGTGVLPKFDANGNSFSNGMIKISGGSYVTLDHLDLYGAGYMNLYVLAGSSTIAGITITNCSIHDTTLGWPMITLQGNGALGSITQVDIENDEFYNFSHDVVRSSEGVTYVTIANNSMHDGYHDAIDTLCDSGLMYDSHFTIHDNDIYNIGWVSLGAHGMYLAGLHDSEIYNNTIHDIATSTGGGDGIGIADQEFVPSGLTIHNNVFWNIPYGATAGIGSALIAYTNPGVNVSTNFWNNTIYNVDRPDRIDGPVGISFANNLVRGATEAGNNLSNYGSDPLFVDPAAMPPDLHLQAGSPAIDAGIDVGLPYTGSAPDLGAYEYGVVTKPPAPPTNLRVLP